MNTIHTFRDLEQFGIAALTGEACAYGMRVLCDLNAPGCELMAEYLGLRYNPDEPPFARNWNSTVDGKPSIASVMLDTQCLERLARFACFRAGALAVAVAPGAVVPITDQDTLERYGEFVEQHRTYQLYRNPRSADAVGSRNVHAFTGRTL